MKKWRVARVGVGVGGNANSSIRVVGYANFCVFRYQNVGIPYAKLWHWGSKPTQGLNANGFAEYRLKGTSLIDSTIFPCIVILFK